MILGATTASIQKAATILTEARNLIAGGSDVLPTGESRITNPLHDYALYNYLFSLTVLDDESFNSSSYRITGPTGPFLARSASMTPEDRVATIYGKFEFFIEDVKIDHVIGFDQTTGNTNAIGFNFKVIEPYSMGLFFQALQTSAKEKKWDNYLDAPLLLTLEFKGHQDFDNQLITIPKTTKYFPLKLRLIDMKVSARGCEYDIAAYPYNEYAFEQSKVTLPIDVSIVGKTVLEMLKTGSKSLEVALNSRSKDNEKDQKVDKGDQFEIVFPNGMVEIGPIFDNLEEDNVNEIGKADMGFSLYNSGKTPFADDNLTYENGIYKRGNISINPKESAFSFGQGSDIINAINQVILMSDYGRNALKNITPDGFVKWWRVEVEVRNLNPEDNVAKTGTKPRKFTYRVVPYLADSSAFLPPNERRKGVELDKMQVLKEYNYIYSGKNIDVVDFDINFKTGFYTVITADAGQDSKGEVTRATGSSVADANQEKTNRRETQQVTGKQKVAPGSVPTQSNASALWTSTTGKGSFGGREDEAARAARQFYDAISSGVDMINVDMTILGDPYYIGDSGVGNYHAEPGINKYINSDESMNWDNGEIHILLNFKTPLDNGADSFDGLYNFGTVYTVPQFSGLYRVLRGESHFTRGKFTQVLKMLRLRNQDSEEGTGKLLQSTEKVTKDEEVPIPVGDNTDNTDQGTAGEVPDGINY